MRREIQCEGASRRGKFIFGEMRTCPLEHRYRKCFHTFPSRASSPVKMFGQTCGVKRRKKQIGEQIERRINLEEGLKMGRRMSKKKKQRSVSLEACCLLYWRGVLLPGQPAGPVIGIWSSAPVE